MNATVTAAIVAGVVSLAAAALSYRASTSTARIQLTTARDQLETAKGQVDAARSAIEQTQIRDLVLRRLDLYAGLWQINIRYETNWVLEGRPKTREWATSWFDELNEFNLRGGLYFSEHLYQSFARLRSALYEAVRSTLSQELVDPTLTQTIRDIVYGTATQSGLSSYLKDDIGSYRESVAQVRGGRRQDPNPAAVTAS